MLNNPQLEWGGIRQWPIINGHLVVIEAAGTKSHLHSCMLGMNGGMFEGADSTSYEVHKLFTKSDEFINV